MPMESNNEIVPAASQHVIDRAKMQSHDWLNPEAWRTMQMIAQTFVQSGALPQSMNTAPKMMVVLQAGKEAGLQPLEAINSFYFVNGKVAMYGEMVIAQVMKAGHTVKWGECNDQTATVTIIRGDNRAENTATFTMLMAKERGLTKNPVYAKYPENMLRFKAFHSCAKFIVPDALHGVPVKEILEAEYEETPAEKKEYPKTEANGASVINQVQDPAKVENLEAVASAEPKPEVVEELGFKETSKTTNAEYIAEIERIAGEKNLDMGKAVAAFKVEKITDMKKEDLKKLYQAVTAAKARELKTEEKDPTPEQIASIPEDVCKLLNWYDSIDKAEWPEMLETLQGDVFSGNFKGYAAYPGIKEEIAKLPE